MIYFYVNKTGLNMILPEFAVSEFNELFSLKPDVKSHIKLVSVGP